jgi:uncharacterized protein
LRIAAGRHARFGGQSRILDAFPVERVGEFHLGGFAEDCDSEGQQLLIDDHGQSVADTVWNLYRHALARQRLAPTLIEWDNNIPAFSTLVREVERARASILAQTGETPAMQAA